MKYGARHKHAQSKGWGINPSPQVSMLYGLYRYMTTYGNPPRAYIPEQLFGQPMSSYFEEIQAVHKSAHDGDLWMVIQKQK